MHKKPQKLNLTKPNYPWFSPLLRHPARKRIGPMLTKKQLLEAARGPRSWSASIKYIGLHCNDDYPCRLSTRPHKLKLFYQVWAYAVSTCICHVEIKHYLLTCLTQYVVQTNSVFALRGWQPLPTIISPDSVCHGSAPASEGTRGRPLKYWPHRPPTSDGH